MSSKITLKITENLKKIIDASTRKDFNLIGVQSIRRCEVKTENIIKEEIPIENGSLSVFQNDTVNKNSESASNGDIFLRSNLASNSTGNLNFKASDFIENEALGD